MSKARSQLLEALESVSKVCDSDLVRTSSSAKGGSMNVASIVCKGLMVASFNAFESFVESRWAELLNREYTTKYGFQNLPEKTQVRMLRNVISVLGRYHFRDDLGGFRTQLGELGHFFEHVNNDGGYIHPFVGRWKGSNITSSELVDGLKCFHVDNPWESMQWLYDVVIASSASADGFRVCDAFNSVVSQRHIAAHQMDKRITRLELSDVPRTLRHIAFCFDVLASTAVYLMCDGRSDYYSNDKYVTTSIFDSFWEISELDKGFAAYLRRDLSSGSRSCRGSSRARKKEQEREAIREWVQKKRSGLQFIVEFSSSGSLSSWETAL